MKIALFGLSVGLVLGLALSASAENAGGKPPGDQPCAKIMEACKAAGFVKGAAKEKKGLWKDCMDPIMAGQSVPGVNVEAADIQACQARRKKPTGR